MGDTWLWNGNSWQNVTDQVYGPSPRAGAPCRMIEEDGKIYLFGGRRNGNFLNDLWADGMGKEMDKLSDHVESVWKGPRKNGSPQDATGNLILFGGMDEMGFLTDMWRWDEIPGRIDPPSHRPDFSAVATDEENGQVLLFGGIEGFLESMGDTWAWNGLEWIKKRPSTSPSPRVSASMAFDGRHILLFGGSYYDSVEGSDYYYNDTWVWDGENWRKIDTPTDATPPGRTGAALAYNPLTGQVVMFGGYGSNESFWGDTWVWDGEAWNEFHQPEGSPSPSPMEGVSLAYD
ncbi:MAG: hypothetical protein IMW85_07990, partial [Thermicanus sp.]|nr:hypothetical protein [Thermicanus sp.]